MNRDPRAFERFAPASPIFAPNRLIYSPRIMHNFVFTQEDLTPHQDHYLNRLVDLLHENGIRLAILNVPQYSEKESGKVIERFDWSNRFGRDIPLVGVPPSTLFDGFTEEEVEKLHCDREHFNANGNEYFTRSILPGIMEVYDRNAIYHF